MFGVLIAEPNFCRTLRLLRGLPYKKLLSEQSRGLSRAQLAFLTKIPDGSLKRILAPIGQGHGYWEDDEVHAAGGYLPNIENAAKLAEALTSPHLALWPLAQLVKDVDPEDEDQARQAWSLRDAQERIAAANARVAALMVELTRLQARGEPTRRDLVDLAGKVHEVMEALAAVSVGTTAAARTMPASRGRRVGGLRGWWRQLWRRGA